MSADWANCEPSEAVGRRRSSALGTSDRRALVAPCLSLGILLLELADFRARRPEVSTETIEKYLHNLWRVQPDFLYSVPRDFISSCRTPILVLPDDTPSHPLPTSIDVASLAPNAEITVFPWREPPELKTRTINRVRTFLKSHVPMRSAA
jgi:hypothetical protein